MTPERWSEIDRYLTDRLVPPDAVLDGVLRACAEAGLPSHEVTPSQGKLLELLARACGAKRILEIGTLGGYRQKVSRRRTNERPRPCYTLRMAPRRDIHVAFGALLGIAGCAADTEEQPDPDMSPPPCVAGAEQTTVQGCQAGIPPERCGAGFEPDGAMGCSPLTPTEPCPAGMMAIPGETSCREVAPCGSTPWGSIPTDATTEFVDAGYANLDSDGSQQKPWTTIAAALAAAAPGAIVAVAAGDYVEELTLIGKAVKLWGRCPAMVAIRGSGVMIAAVEVGVGADGTEIRNLAVTSASSGVILQGAANVVLDRLWVHDTGERGIALQPVASRTSARLSASLIEKATDVGVHVVGADAVIEASAVRETRESQMYATGYGASIQPSPMDGTPASAEIHGSILERNHTAAVLLVGSTATVDGSLALSTLPSQLSARDGVGVIAQDDNGQRSTLSLETSVVAGNRARGVAVVGSDATISAVHVADTLPQEWDGSNGEGLAVLLSNGASATATVDISTFSNNHQSSVFVRGSSATLRSVLVKDTQPRGSDQAFGRGIAVVGEMAVAANAVIEGCLIDASKAFGIYLADGTANVSSTLIRLTSAQAFDGDFGHGIGVATLDPAVLGGPSRVTLLGTLVETSARSGLLSMGAHATLDGSSLECNQGGDVLGLESYLGQNHPFTFEDAGRNVCGCGQDRRTCEL